MENLSHFLLLCFFVVDDRHVTQKPIMVFELRPKVERSSTAAWMPSPLSKIPMGEESDDEDEDDIDRLERKNALRRKKRDADLDDDDGEAEAPSDKESVASGSSGADAGAGGIDRAHSERQPAAAGAATAADVQQVIDFFSSAASAAASAATGEEEEEEEDSAELGDDWVQLGGSNIHLRKHMSKGSMDQVYDPSNLQVTFRHLFIIMLSLFPVDSFTAAHSLARPSQLPIWTDRKF